MDAVEYVKTQYRLCRSKDSCSECPLQDKEKCGCIMDKIEYVEKAVQIVEQWAKDNPVKTRQSEFLKIFPKAWLQEGVIDICPDRVSGENICEYDERCGECKKDFWMAEVK